MPHRPKKLSKKQLQEFFTKKPLLFSPKPSAPVSPLLETPIPKPIEDIPPRTNPEESEDWVMVEKINSRNKP